MVHFPVSGVDTWVWLPPLVALVVSFFTSMAGVSGAFLLLPFQVSVLGFATPAVSATNLVFNLVATPGGVWRYWQEGRMAWPLVRVVAAGTLPGLYLGYRVRVDYLPDPRHFKLFVGCVLLYVGYRLLSEFLAARKTAVSDLEAKFAARQAEMGGGIHAGLKTEARVRTLGFSFSRAEYEFWGGRYGFSVPRMFLLALVVGLVGGAYGIGGGAIIAPFCVAFFRLPIYTVAGAALAATLVTSLAGVVLYSVLPAPPGMNTRPDWLLGLLFGLGGFAGTYLGARMQKYLPQRALKLLLGSLLALLALRYLATALAS